MPLISIGVVYAGLVVGLLVMGRLSTPEYEHVSDLHIGLIWLAWSVLALAGLTVSITSYRRSTAPLLHWSRGIAVVLQSVVGIILVGALPLSIINLVAYRNGITAYDAEVERCGHPPVLAMTDIVGQNDVVLPTDSDYERLKYSTADLLTLTPTTYYCSLADAEADGYRHFP
jgi:hypothetical protein